MSSTPKVVPVDDLALSDTASRFEGRDHGSTISVFVTRHPTGSGVKLHRHPYEETFVVQEGVGTFTVDGKEIEVPAGHILVVPAGAAHGFANKGDDLLRQVTIHPNDRVVQEWVE